MWSISNITLSGKNIQNTRPVGAPKARWEDAAQRDTRVLLELRGWTREAIHREKWRHLLKETKVQKGLLRHERRSINIVC